MYSKIPDQFLIIFERIGCECPVLASAHVQEFSFAEAIVINIASYAIWRTAKPVVPVERSRKLNLEDNQRLESEGQRRAKREGRRAEKRGGEEGGRSDKDSRETMQTPLPLLRPWELAPALVAA